VKPLGAAVLLLLALLVASVLAHGAVFDDYSHRFGSLSQEEFAALNRRMDLLAWVTRAAVLALVPSDLALIVVAARRRSFVVMGLALVLGVLLLLFVAISAAAVGPALIG
jgi:hypothetical protein